ncbi:uncharacterized protein LODBEIA_P04420 [Lodderomyces beijingensis]|uniref:Uncharacterized protein n=1 Tax=Lodderomyces beijingensis TaxID=1775926 RepID=A0ABP0ZDG8_9ASCO
MSTSVREIFDTDKTRYFMSKQSKIDQFCARSKDRDGVSCSGNGSGGGVRLQQVRLRNSNISCPTSDPRRVLFTREEWRAALRGLKLAFPVSLTWCQSNEDESSGCLLWDKAGESMILSHEESIELYNR